MGKYGRNSGEDVTTDEAVDCWQTLYVIFMEEDDDRNADLAKQSMRTYIRKQQIERAQRTLWGPTRFVWRQP